MISTEANLTHFLFSGTFRRPSVCRLSVCNFRVLYSAGWNFAQCFYAILYHRYPLTFMQNSAEIVD